jgi:hypothetical protein
VGVQVSGGQILEFGKESFKLYTTRRNPGAATRRISFGYLGKTFSLINNALEAVVPFEHLRDGAIQPGINLATRAVNLVMKVLSLGLEYEQAALALDATKYDATHKIALAGVSKWSDPASDPAKQIDDYREAVRASVGIYPNTLALSALAFKAIRNNPQIIERFKYTGRDSITAAMLAALFDLEKVVVGKMVLADEDDVISDIWGNNAVLAFVPANPSGMEEPSYGYTYAMEGHPSVESPYYEKNSKSWLYPMSYERAPVLSGITSGFLIQNPN